jgi:hypothetical protein
VTKTNLAVQLQCPGSSLQCRRALCFWHFRIPTPTHFWSPGNLKTDYWLKDLQERKSPIDASSIYLSLPKGSITRAFGSAVIWMCSKPSAAMTCVDHRAAKYALSAVCDTPLHIVLHAVLHTFLMCIFSVRFQGVYKVHTQNAQFTASTADGQICCCTSSHCSRPFAADPKSTHKDSRLTLKSQNSCNF